MVPFRSMAVLVALVAQPLAAAPSASYRVSDFATVKKFDAHVHINAAAEAFVAQARRDGFDVLTINVDYPDFPTIDAQQHIAVAAHRNAPKRVQFATTFPMRGWGTPAWDQQTKARLTSAVASGAVAVKIWKNIGMSEKDSDGKLLMIDNPRFDPLIAHIGSLNIPVIGHQGEPKNCWLPLDQMTTDNDRSYFAEHPQYHMYLHPDQPSYETQIAARDAFLARNPALRFVGAHMASLEWSVDALAAFLDAHPLATVDLAARMTQVQYQSVTAREAVRAFFIRYQDRLLYGSDASINSADTVAETLQATHKAWLSDWTYLATAEKQDVADIKATVPGLALPRAVIDKIYRTNAQRVFLGKR